MQKPTAQPPSLQDPTAYALSMQQPTQEAVAGAKGCLALAFSPDPT